jgi:hypothetical protein
MRRKRTASPMTCNLDFVQQTHNFISFVVKSCGMCRLGMSAVCAMLCALEPWQKGGKTLIDEPFPEDGTDFLSYAAGAFGYLPDRNLRCVVVARHAGQT